MNPLSVDCPPSKDPSENAFPAAQPNAKLHLLQSSGLGSCREAAYLLLQMTCGPRRVIGPPSWAACYIFLQPVNPLALFFTPEPANRTPLLCL